MATITVYTAERMKQIEDTTVIGGSIDGDNLMLETREGILINSGNVRGPQGDRGLTGEVSAAQLAAVSSVANTALQTAQAAGASAASALATAQAAKVITYGRSVSGALEIEYFKYTNGVTMLWAYWSSASAPAFATAGNIYRATPVLFYPGRFSSDAGNPNATVGLAAVGLGATWGSPYEVRWNRLTIQIFSAYPSTGPIEISYFVVGKWTQGQNYDIVE